MARIKESGEENPREIPLGGVYLVHEGYSEEELTIKYPEFKTWALKRSHSVDTFPFTMHSRHSLCVWTTGCVWA